MTITKYVGGLWIAGIAGLLLGLYYNADIATYISIGILSVALILSRIGENK